ncbi:hypothetical protein RND81_11G123500 [Saponaria officinalis]|uniref:RanBD1 domain-containing protein n=1 Tax=Saponaria officinalis TaxID=3572 RepID=A0AAW1HL81_SAPOF
MGEENQPSKKRAAGRELSRDNPGLDDDEDVDETEMGTFKKASDEVLATRKIVKVRRQQTSTTPSGPTSNPFAGIRLVPTPPDPAPAPANAPTEAQAVEDDAAVDDSETKDDATTEPKVKNAVCEEKPMPVQQPEVNQLDQAVGDTAENVVAAKPVDEVSADDEKTNGVAPTDEKQAVNDKAESNDKNENEKTEDNTGTPWKSFQQLSNSQNAFTGVAGSGFPTSAFSFGSIQKDGSGSPSQPSVPTFSFGTSNSSSTPLFGTTVTGSSFGGKTEGSAFSSAQEVPRETGEENEETVFSADSILFEFIDGGWKERGKGEVKVNVLKDETRKARLVMRAKGNLRLILNASLYSDLKLTKMEKKGITFACVNSANDIKDSLSTFALKFKDASIVEEFSSVVSTHKGKPATSLKTPENSPNSPEAAEV